MPLSNRSRVRPRSTDRVHTDVHMELLVSTRLTDGYKASLRVTAVGKSLKQNGVSYLSRPVITFRSSGVSLLGRRGSEVQILSPRPI